jgi:hypothetical protein
MPLRLPDTIVFSRSAPTAWFYSTSRGELARRPDSCLNIEAVLETFAPGVFSAGTENAIPPGLEAVAAAFIASSATNATAAASSPATATATTAHVATSPLMPLDPSSTEIYAQFVYSSSYALGGAALGSSPNARGGDGDDGGGVDDDGGERYIVYLTALELLRLLRDINPDLRSPRVFGTLQRFVRPGGWPAPNESQRRAASALTQRQRHRQREHLSQQSQQHTVCKAVWTPRYFGVECRVNHQLYTTTSSSAPLSSFATDLTSASTSAAASIAAAAVLSKLVTFDWDQRSLDSLQCRLRPFAPLVRRRQR